MVDLDREADDPDSPLHDLLVAALEAVQLAALPEGPDGLAGALNFTRGICYVLATVGLLLDKRLAMSERNRG